MSISGISDSNFLEMEVPGSIFCSTVTLATCYIFTLTLIFRSTKYEELKQQWIYRFHHRDFLGYQPLSPYQASHRTLRPSSCLGEIRPDGAAEGRRTSSSSGVQAAKTICKQPEPPRRLTSSHPLGGVSQVQSRDKTTTHMFSSQCPFSSN